MKTSPDPGHSASPTPRSISPHLGQIAGRHSAILKYNTKQRNQILNIVNSIVTILIRLV